MKRRPNFSAVEMDALIDGVAESRAIVANACPVRVSKSVKEREWHSITGRVNSVSALHRTVGEVRKKWKNLRMVTKAKKEALLSDFVQLCRADAAAAALKQLTPVECRVMEILESSAVAGSVDDADSQGNLSTIAVDIAAADAGAPLAVVGGDVVEDDVEEDEDDEDAWSRGDQPLVIDRSEIIMQKPLLLPQPPSTQLSPQQIHLQLQPPLMQQLHLQQPSLPTKPSILSVVEALQRRLVVVAASPEAEAAVTSATAPVEPGSSSSHAMNGNDISPTSDFEAAAAQVGDSVAGVERRILRIEERRLQLEREKVAAMREIVANLRDIARMIGVGGGGSGGGHLHCCCHHARRHGSGQAVLLGNESEKDVACQTSAPFEDP